MENIIKKAIEGGYETPEYGAPVLYINAKMFGKNTAKRMYDCYVTSDPLFWQALGKSCGWYFCRFRGSAESGDKGGCCDERHDQWFEYAQKFSEINLTEGWSKAVEYLLSLTK